MMQSTTPTLAVVEKTQFKAYGRPLAEITADLAKPVPQRFLAQRKQGKQELTYIPWHHVNRLLDYYAPGWEGEVTKIVCTSDRIFVTYRLTIHAAEGAFSREATGTEVLKEEYFDKVSGTTKIRELAYGDSSSNAESMAFRRSAARFGLGLSLYLKD